MRVKLHIIIPLILLGLVSGCNSHEDADKQKPQHDKGAVADRAAADREEVVERYDDGSPLEVRIEKGSPPEIIYIKSFYYYRTGEKRRVFYYKDNNFYGPWTFWYRDGTVFAEGMLFEKTLDPEQGIGSATYYWPDGTLMLEFTATAAGKAEGVTYRNMDDGRKYALANVPEPLKERITRILVQWQQSEI